MNTLGERYSVNKVEKGEENEQESENVGTHVICRSTLDLLGARSVLGGRISAGNRGGHDINRICSVGTGCHGKTTD